MSGIVHPLLVDCSVDHAFGERTSTLPAGAVRPRQVHGRAVARVGSTGEPQPVEADAIVCDTPTVPVAIVTADCVPLLACTRSGGAVAAIHAGWRGLASGVIEAGIAALRELGGPEEEVVAAIGPCIGACCYEVDEPVIAALRSREGSALDLALRPTRPGHWRLDLAHVASLQLRAAGVGPAASGQVASPCTFCDASRFFSYRREGASAGRLQHYIAARSPRSREG